MGGCAALAAPWGTNRTHTPASADSGQERGPGPAAGANERRGSLVTHALTAQDGRAWRQGLLTRCQPG